MIALWAPSVVAEGNPALSEVESDMTPESHPNIPFGCCQCGCGQQTKPYPRSNKALGQICGAPSRFIIGHQARLRGYFYDRTKHGHDKKGQQSPTYKSWMAMKSRCSPYAKGRKRVYYFERGVKVCERWMDFKNFLADMGERPSRKHSIDRINNDGNYELSNCRWATSSEQAQNRRKPGTVFRAEAKQ